MGTGDPTVDEPRECLREGGGGGWGHLKNSRVCEASRKKTSLTQQPFYQRADVQGIGLVVADQQQGAVQGDGPTPLLHLPILCCGQEDRALKRLQIVQCPAV